MVSQRRASRTTLISTSECNGSTDAEHAAHTPGPWDCEMRSFAGVKWDGIIRSKKKRDPICSIFVAGYMAKEANANARLIAAAPDMRAEITACWRKLEDFGFPPEASGWPWCDVAGKLPQAIEDALDCVIRQREDLLKEVIQLRAKAEGRDG